MTVSGGQCNRFEVSLLTMMLINLFSNPLSHSDPACDLFVLHGQEHKYIYTSHASQEVNHL